MLSYHVNADKHARRASLKDRRVGQAERCIQAVCRYMSRL
ncbi:hypothetical protein ID866_13081 [Astraeus odoratus]|nr:hypothetical protein ID866_13081 [Astraeus odoratus]